MPSEKILSEKLSGKRRIKRIGVFQAGKFLAIWYGLFGLVLIPFTLLASLFGLQMNAESFGPFVVGIGLTLILPFIHAILGFIAGIIIAFLYNVVAMFAGGIEIELE